MFVAGKILWSHDNIYKNESWKKDVYDIHSVKIYRIYYIKVKSGYNDVKLLKVCTNINY